MRSWHLKDPVAWPVVNHFCLILRRDGLILGAADIELLDAFVILRHFKRRLLRENSLIAKQGNGKVDDLLRAIAVEKTTN